MKEEGVGVVRNVDEGGGGWGCQECTHE